MNILLFQENELCADGIVHLEGERARHLIKIKKVQEGDSFAAGVIDGRVGSAKIISKNKTSLEVKVELFDKARDLEPVDLVVALPRPQILKKVLYYGSMCGVRSISFINSIRTEDSYYSSSMLEADNIKKYLVLGLEQSMTTKLPEISVSKDFEIPESNNSFKLIAEPSASQHIAELESLYSSDLSKGLSLSIGPEGGWQEQEIEAFKNKGFISFNLGSRVLRVEVALAYLLGQLDLFRHKSSASHT